MDLTLINILTLKQEYCGILSKSTEIQFNNYQKIARRKAVSSKQLKDLRKIKNNIKLLI